MKARFFEAVERLARGLRGGETLLCGFSGERSDFVRFNRGRVRQAGSVEQGYITVRLIAGRRQASCTSTMPRAEFSSLLEDLRRTLEVLPEDPLLLINETPQSTSSERRGTLPSTEEIVAYADGARDFVGIYAGGTLYRGFANSLGQRNWHEVDSFNFDWSLHGAPGDAVKSGYAGLAWDGRVQQARVERAVEQLALLARPRKALPPGEYRAYLAPRAMEELVGMLAWGGFSARARQTRQSPLLRMQEGARLSPAVSLRESTAEGIAPGFQGDGFIKPGAVSLIQAGVLDEPLVSPRSAKEYGLAGNGASNAESPESLDMAPGTLEEKDILAALDTGLYLSNLWYLNYSDRPAGRITGMTRFAAFWVEGGRIAAPLAPMRFDDSIYRMLGERLLGLTRERELLLDPSTYGARSTASARLPGALLGALRLTL